jgi:hypothetical protein
VLKHYGKEGEDWLKKSLDEFKAAVLIKPKTTHSK